MDFWDVFSFRRMDVEMIWRIKRWLFIRKLNKIYKDSYGGVFNEDDVQRNVRRWGWDGLRS